MPSRPFVDNYSGDFDAMVLDLTMSDMEGIELIRFLAGKNCASSLILISGYGKGMLGAGGQLAQEPGLNVMGVIHRPIDVDRLSGLLCKVEVREAV